MAHIFNSCIESAESTIKSMSILDRKSFMSGMKGGDYDCLKMLTDFEKGQKG